MDLCVARTGQEHIHSDEPERALLLLPIDAPERSGHKPHIGINERKRLLFASLDVGSRYRAIDKSNAAGALEVADAGWLLSRFTEYMEGSHWA